MTSPRVKTLVTAALLVATLGACASAPAPVTPTTPPAGAVFLVRTAGHLEVAVKTAAELLSRDGASGLRVPEARVVACGPLVRSLTADGPLRDTLAAARTNGVEVEACGLSLERAEVSPTTLAPGVRVVPNGLVEVLLLEARGYVSVTL